LKQFKWLRFRIRSFTSWSSRQRCNRKSVGLWKVQYEQKKKQQELKKNQSKVENKEIRLTVGIGEHDLETKAKKAREF
jgi:hypothetical protein